MSRVKMGFFGKIKLCNYGQPQHVIHTLELAVIIMMTY